MTNKWSVVLWKMGDKNMSYLGSTEYPSRAAAARTLRGIHKVSRIHRDSRTNSYNVMVS